MGAGAPRVVVRRDRIRTGRTLTRGDSLRYHAVTIVVS